MRFKEYLAELEEQNKPFTTAMPMEAAFEWIKEHSRSYATGLKRTTSAIWRGMNPKDSGAQWGDTSKFKRSSANTNNYYTLLIDSSEKWEQYPKRGRAFICSSGEGNSSSYGSLFYVFPADKTELGICPRNDIWNSFRPKLQELELRSLNHLNKFLDNMGQALGLQMSETDANALRSDLKMMTWEKINSVRNKEEHFPMGDANTGAAIQIADFMNKHDLDDMEEVIEFILDPQEAEFDLVLTSHFHQNNDYGREIWFNGHTVFIPSSWLLNKDSEFNKLFTAEFGEFK